MIFTLADNRFFEDIAIGEHDGSFHQVICEQLPAHWSALQNGVWLSVSSSAHVYPAHGFKIHVSGTPAHAAEIIRRVAPLCYANDTPFKTARDPRMLSLMGSKHYPRGNAGKLMTIYPLEHAMFLRLIDLLHSATQGLDGPYILSDRRYLDSGIVYYRYGEILSTSRLLPDGSAQSELIGPDGQAYQEDRLPFYRLPPWVSDPFVANETLTYKGPQILNQRYRIEKAIAFSNSGGVYRAVDQLTGETVVLKEARPHTAHYRAEGGDIDAVYLLEHEFAILQLLAGTPGVVTPIEIFSEWEHRFLAEALVPGIPLSQYRARSDFSLFPYEGDAAIAMNFCRKFGRIAQQLLLTVQAIHARGVLVGDLSPNNILIEPDTLDVCLIDFEGALTADRVVPEAFSAQWSTPGFRHERREQALRITPADDWYALGMVLYSLILPMQTLFDLDKRRVEDFLDALSDAAALPGYIAGSVRSLLAGDPDLALRLLAADQPNVADAVPPLSTAQAPMSPEVLLEGLTAFIESVCQPDRPDRLWPGDPEIFRSNSLSLAYGAAGPLLLQCVLGKTCTTEQQAWLDHRTERLDRYPPGLYTGLAGLACVYAHLGDGARATHLLDEIRNSVLFEQHDSLFLGEAGFVLACLLVHAQLGDDRLLEWAAHSGERLLKKAQADEHGCHWPSQRKGEQRELGLAYGGSGIALALLQLSKTLDSASLLRCAQQAMESELKLAIPRGPGLRWGRYSGDLVDEPYWLHGGSGIGTVLVRFASICKDARYVELAAAAAIGCYSRFTVLPGQIEGMSGIGEFMLDMYQLTGEIAYLQRARTLASTIALYRVEGQHSLAFPGRGLQRLSCDYAYGAAGAALFLHRLVNGGPRLMHDLIHGRAQRES